MAQASAAARGPAMDVVFSEYFPYVRHPATLPPLGPDGVDGRRHKVVIAGGGPTGLALALGLANFGVPSVVIEADETVCTGSRAGAFTRRTLEIFERLGVIEPIMASCLRWNTGWTYFRDVEVYRLDMPDDANQKYPAAISQLQNYIEQCLVAEADKRGGLIDIRWQSKVARVQASNDGVRLDVETPLGAYALDADWLVACDGGQSAVRQALGLRMSGERHAGRYVIVDVRIDTADFPAGRRCWFDPPSNPGGTLLMYKKPGGMARFDYQLNDDEDVEQAMKPENVFARVASHLKMLGVDRPWEPVWLSFYRASALTLDSYRHGKVLFAGDAAHLVPIFGVRGMNSAVDDAHNLAWKLALTVHGAVDDAVLDTYSDERVFAARENIRYASKGAEFMSPPSAPHRLMRDAVLSLSRAHPWITSLMNPRQHAAVAFTGSALTAAADKSREFTAGPAPGAVLAECPVEIGGAPGHLTDLLGPWFSIFYFGDAPADLKAACDALAARVPLKLHSFAAGTAPLFAVYGAAAGTVYAVRPDGHVMARWRQGTPADLRDAFDRILTQEARV